MNSVYLSLINLCVQSLSPSLSVSMVGFPYAMSEVSVAHNASVGMVSVVRLYIHHIYNIVTNIQAWPRKYRFYHNLSPAFLMWPDQEVGVVNYSGWV